MQKGIKLYNVIFPLWLLIILPAAWLVVVPANFVVDSLVILIALKALKQQNIMQHYKKTILKTWVFGFIADLIGSVLLLISVFSAQGDSAFSSWWYDNISGPLGSNVFRSPLAFCYMLIIVAIVGVIIYNLNMKIAFKNLDIDELNKKRLALCLAISTAPYAFFIPTSMIFNGF